MNRFLQVMFGMDPGPALAELEEQAHLWELIQIRQEYEGSAHKDTECIVLRGPTHTDDLFNNLEASDFPYVAQLPHVLAYLRPILEHLKAREIGRVMLVRLKAGGHITPHTDEGAYARYYARFHAPLITNVGCLFNCGDDVVHMPAGTLWWFNHQVEHSVDNRGAARIHLILDVAAPGYTGALAL